jgi:ASPIC/UnbV protein
VNNDGKMDVLVADADGPPVLLINRTNSPNHAVIFRLIGKKSNKAAIGARVRVTAGDLTQMSEVQAGSSYLSQNDLRLHFGLSAHATMDKVEIFWPSGIKETYENLSADFIYTLLEGGGIQSRVPFETNKLSLTKTPSGLPSRQKETTDLVATPHSAHCVFVGPSQTNVQAMRGGKALPELEQTFVFNFGRALGGAPFVAMMQPAHLRDFDHLAGSWLLNGTMGGSIFTKRQVSARSIVVVEIGS